MTTLEKDLIHFYLIGFMVISILLCFCVLAFAYTDDEIANAIYKAEGGAKTNHPYGILTKYKNTTSRQACLNTIEHAYKDWNGEGDFIEFLGNRYAPIGVANDPTELNKNWVRNVKYFLEKEVRK